MILILEVGKIVVCDRLNLWYIYVEFWMKKKYVKGEYVKEKII